jgi:hypothetical protein
MSTYSERLAAGSGRKSNTHPQARAAKIEIRRRVLTAIGADKAHVLDAYAGDGEMFRAVWKEAASYAGCDLRWYPDERLAYVCDNRRLLRVLDLVPFTVFDFDAYGSPWELCYLLAKRRGMARGERLGVVLTEGTGLQIKFGGVAKALKMLAGVRGKIPGGIREQPRIIDAGIAGLVRQLGGRLTHRWQADRKGGTSMHYIGLVIERD